MSFLVVQRKPPDGRTRPLRKLTPEIFRMKLMAHPTLESPPLRFKSAFEAITDRHGSEVWMGYSCCRHLEENTDPRQVRCGILYKSATNAGMRNVALYALLEVLKARKTPRITRLLPTFCHTVLGSSSSVFDRERIQREVTQAMIETRLTSMEEWKTLSVIQLVIRLLTRDAASDRGFTKDALGEFLVAANEIAPNVRPVVDKMALKVMFGKASEAVANAIVAEFLRNKKITQEQLVSGVDSRRSQK